MRALTGIEESQAPGARVTTLSPIAGATRSAAVDQLRSASCRGPAHAISKFPYAETRHKGIYLDTNLDIANTLAETRLLRRIALTTPPLAGALESGQVASSTSPESCAAVRLCSDAMMLSSRRSRSS